MIQHNQFYTGAQINNICVGLNSLLRIRSAWSFRRYILYINDPNVLATFFHRIVMILYVIYVKYNKSNKNKTYAIQTNLCIQLSYLEDQRNLKIYNKLKNTQKNTHQYAWLYSSHFQIKSFQLNYDHISLPWGKLWILPSWRSLSYLGPCHRSTLSPCQLSLWYLHGEGRSETLWSPTCGLHSRPAFWITFLIIQKKVKWCILRY